MPSKPYDWNGWFAAGQFTLIRGEDYTCRTSSIVQQVRNEASKRKLPVHIAESEGAIVVSVRGSSDASG